MNIQIYEHAKRLVNDCVEIRESHDIVILKISTPAFGSLQLAA